jgi:hypothetical protein
MLDPEEFDVILTYNIWYRDGRTVIDSFISFLNINNTIPFTVNWRWVFLRNSRWTFHNHQNKPKFCSLNNLASTSVKSRNRKWKNRVFSSVIQHLNIRLSSEVSQTILGSTNTNQTRPLPTTAETKLTETQAQGTVLNKPMMYSSQIVKPTTTEYKFAGLDTMGRFVGPSQDQNLGNRFGA